MQIKIFSSCLPDDNVSFASLQNNIEPTLTKAVAFLSENLVSSLLIVSNSRKILLLWRKYNYFHLEGIDERCSFYQILLLDD